MFKVEMEIRCRCHVMKSMFPLEGTVLSQNEKQMRGGYVASLEWLGDKVEKSMQ